MKVLKTTLLIYIFIQLSNVYNLFYKVWFNFNITATTQSGREVKAVGGWTGYDLIKNDVVNTANGLSNGVAQIAGLPLIMLVFAIATALLYFGYTTNAFVFCLAPFLCSIYVKTQLNLLHFKMLNPSYGGNFNSMTDVPAQVGSSIAQVGYVGLLLTFVTFIKYRKENPVESSGLLKKAFNFSRDNE